MSNHGVFLKAGEGSRTLNIDLGKVALCQLSYAHDIQSHARICNPSFHGTVRGYEMFCDNGAEKEMVLK